LAAGAGPQGVLDEMDEYVRTYGLNEDDQAWLVMDVDHHTHGVNLQILNAVTEKAGTKSYGVALSNACFEVWLMLHLTETVPALPSTQMERETRRVWPAYNKSRYDARHLKDGIADAMQRAKTRDTTPDEPMPKQSGTRIYRLMEDLRAAIEKAGGTPPF